MPERGCCRFSGLQLRPTPCGYFCQSTQTTQHTKRKRAHQKKRHPIGQLAANGGVNVETIRYYQREKFLPTPKRLHGAIRRYGEEDLKHLLFIKRAQVLGFSLTEIALLFQLAEGEHCAETQALAEKKLDVIKRKLADLLAIESVLKKLIRLPQRKRRLWLPDY